MMVDDSLLYLDSMRVALSTSSALYIERVFDNPVQFLGELQTLKADVVFLDIEMPRVSGSDCIAEIRGFRPDLKVIMLTVVDDDDAIFQCLKRGADGYLLKDSSPRQITQAVNDAIDGGAPMSSLIARRVVEQFKQSLPVSPSEEIRPEVGVLGKLSRREREVLDKLAQGLKYHEIGQQLSVVPDTIKKHVRSIYTKLEVRNRTEATIVYIQDS